MVTKSKLRLALAAEKGIDFNKLKQQKKHKEAAKLKPKVNEFLEENYDKEEDKDDEDSSAGEGEEFPAYLEGVDDSDTSDSEVEFEAKIKKPMASKADATKFTHTNVKDDSEVDEEDEDIAVSDLEDLDDEDKEDLIPHNRLTVNNTSALKAALDRISIPKDKGTPFATHQSVVASTETAESIPDVSDDLQRELALYSQCLEAARIGRSKLLAEGVSFSRPKDYFAEMVKEDAHMEKVKAKLIEEASAKKAATEARKLRDLKKFGKQVQVAKLQERQKAKRETLEKIKTLKRKRQESGGGMETNEADIFDVSVDNEIAQQKQRQSARDGQPRGQGANAKRQQKNDKYGFGGKKRHAKSGDAVSSGDLSNFSAKKMKVGGKAKSKASRPGKSRRKALGAR